MTEQTEFRLPLAQLKREWIERNARRVAYFVGMKNLATFTADDLHDCLDKPQEKNWWGGLFARCKRAGIVERVGYQTSKRKSRNGGVIAVWRVR